ncbi:MAG: glycosyltransferase family 2 protein [Patescibacteria group bacterium]
MTKVSCIIPVYNEAERIMGVLNAVVGHELIDEVIVVDDGSTDNSKKALENRSGIQLISYIKNRGKSFAIETGLKKSKNEIVMLIDSDLIGLQAGDLTQLIEPVVMGQADIAITLRKNSLQIYKIFGLDFVSGERVFHKGIIGDLEQLGRLPGFGLEVFLNRIIIDQKLKLKVVPWENVISPRKSKKVGRLQGTYADYAMIRQILRTVSAREVVRQIYRMRALRV